jgi:hypothetical protein
VFGEAVVLEGPSDALIIAFSISVDVNPLDSRN